MRAHPRLSIHLGQILILKEIIKQLLRFAYTNQDMPDCILNKSQEMYAYSILYQEMEEILTLNTGIQWGQAFPWWTAIWVFRILKIRSMSESWLKAKARGRIGPKEEKRFTLKSLKILYISSLLKREIMNYILILSVMSYA